MSYFGHILIWAAHQQRQGKVPIFADKFGISLTSKEVRSKIGGYHLWDKLFRELQGMNSKRWKHVINLETTRTKLTPSKKIFIKMIWIIPYCLILVIF